jgi:hypothetical protein
MKRPLTIYLDGPDLERLEIRSHQRGWTKSQAVRAAIHALTGTAGDDPLLGVNGMADGLPSDLSDRFDHYLDRSLSGRHHSDRHRSTVRH